MESSLESGRWNRLEQNLDVTKFSDSRTPKKSRLYRKQALALEALNGMRYINALRCRYDYRITDQFCNLKCVQRKGDELPLTSRMQFQTVCDCY